MSHFITLLTEVKKEVKLAIELTKTLCAMRSWLLRSLICTRQILMNP